MNKLYWICTFVCYILMYLSYRKSLKIVFHMYIILLFRNTIRLCDFEKTRESREPFYFQILMFTQLMISFTMIGIINRVFIKNKLRFLNVIVCPLICYIAFVSTLFYDMKTTSESLSFGIVGAVGTISCSICLDILDQKIINSLFREMS
jgi:hypothetical protein